MAKEVLVEKIFWNSFIKLGKQDQLKVLNTIYQLIENPMSPSLSMHNVDRERCDKRLSSIRVNLDLRIIVLRDNGRYRVLHVNHHDDAYNWCEGKFIGDSDFGSSYVFDSKIQEEKIQEYKNQIGQNEFLGFLSKQSIFENRGVKVKDLERFGINHEYAENLIKITDEDTLLEHIVALPDDIQEALMDIATGNKSFDVAYNELSNSVAEEKSSDYRCKYTSDNIDELKAFVENQAFEKWMIFLHPSQQKYIDANFNGPMLVEGGPGTGKTVVGVHRAVRLAKECYRAEDGKKILICTFSKKLANSIETKVNMLCKIKGVTNNIKTMSVDAYISSLLKGKNLNVDVEAINLILRDAYNEHDYGKSLDFLLYEYHEIIEKLNIQTEDEYLDVRRVGAGERLTSSQRRQIWPFFKYVLEKKKEKKVYSFVDRAYRLNELLELGEIKKEYDSIIIDEAQDLEAIKLRVICESVKNDRNGITILSDKNQRIFSLNTWSSDAKINVVGRTFYLRINYRTTKQINDYARCQFNEFDDSLTYNKEYISVMSGLEPEFIECADSREQSHVIVDKVKNLLKEYKASEICILAPKYDDLNSIGAVLEFSGIMVTMLQDSPLSEDENHVNLCTTSGVKGLEFAVVIIMDFSNIGTQKSNYVNSSEISVNYEKLVECEKYVSITRARDLVIITNIGA